MNADPIPLPGYAEPYGLLCAILQDGTSEWRAELDWTGEYALGPDAMTWQIRPGGPSMGALLLHIVGVEVYWIERFVLGWEFSAKDKRLLLWEETDVDEGRWPVPPSEPLRWYLDLQDRFRQRTLEAVKAWPEPDRPFEHHERTVTPRWVLGHVIQHEAYHGGQAVLILDLWNRQRSV